MKKMLSVLVALILTLGLTAALAEETPFTIRNNVTFGMNMDDVIASEPVRYHEIDNEHAHGGVTFAELEYKHVTENNVPVEIKYLFVGNELVAVRFNYEARDIGYEQLKADLAAKFGTFSEMDKAALGRGIYAVDDDGRLEGRTEAIVFGNVMIIIEADEDDVDLTSVDLNAAYINV